MTGEVIHEEDLFVAFVMLSSIKLRRDKQTIR
jgi:hypothetical protein